jgi:predicted ATPase/class 3 adenylate cyclase/Tfp pilus assembly protein PilF
MPETEGRRAEQYASGTFTFLFTDIEGSTRMWEETPDLMSQALSLHDAVLSRTFSEHSGHVFKTVGDAFCVSFSQPDSAIEAAQDAQIALAGIERDDIKIRARIGIHTGPAEVRGNDYFGPTVNRVARIRDAGHGGQVLLSQSTVDSLGGELPDGLDLRDMGSHRLKDLAEQLPLYQLVGPHLERDFPPLRTLDARKNNLPTQLTAFIGREEEMRRITEPLRDSARLLTVTGTGGCGKTRLALQGAGEIVEAFEHGVWFVPLASVTAPDLFASEIAQTLNLREDPRKSVFDVVCEYLEDKSALLVLDNFEQITQSAPMVGKILQRCPRTKCLVTSREPLRISGEQIYEIEPLIRSHSVQLFCDRARLVKPDFGLADENRDDIFKICERLDGMPLAIELAAARIRALSPSQILTRLERSLKLLTGGARDAQARHQTLRAAIDWSYELLSEEERELFAVLSVFAGGFTLDAAEAVCCDCVDAFGGVISLHEKSLLKREKEGAEERFYMLQTIREYAAERLKVSGKEPELLRLHAEFFTDLAESLEPEIRGPQQREILNRLGAEAENLRLAYKTADEAQDEQSVSRLALALHHFWIVRGLTVEGHAKIERAEQMAKETGDRAALGKLLNAAALVHHHLGEYAEAGRIYNEALGINREAAQRQALADSLSGAGWWAANKGDTEEGRRLISEAVSIAEEIGAGSLAARSLCDLGESYYHDGRYAQARAQFEQALERARKIGDKRVESISLQWLSDIAQIEGEIDAAREHTLAALQIDRELGNLRSTAWAIDQLAVLALQTGDFARAEELAQQALEIHREVGNSVGINESLARLGKVAQSRGDYGKAEDLLSQALESDRKLDDQAGIATDLIELGALLTCEGDYPRARQALTEAEGIQAELDNKSGLASARTRLGLLAHHEGDAGGAEEYLTETLALNRELSAKAQIAESLLGLARVHLAAGNLAQASQEAREAIELHRKLQDRPGLCLAVAVAAGILAGSGRLREAALCSAYAQHLTKRIGFAPPPAFRQAHERVASEIGAELGDQLWQEIEGQARELEPDQAARAAVEALEGIG